MKQEKAKETASRSGQDLGMIGLGAMGRNLLLNLTDHGYTVAGYDQDEDQVEALRRETGNGAVRAVARLAELVDGLERPRAVMLLVPAGKATDAVIEELLPLLEAGDVVIDGGNSHFRDTDRRIAVVQRRGMYYLGMGVSGGDRGARRGPSLMPGGSPEAYARVAPLLQHAAAKVDGEPCVSYLGPGSAGHYVKMVHNGIEYGLMQLIAEAYDLLGRGLGLDNDQLHRVFADWARSPIASYLVEITANIFATRDEETGRRLVDLIMPAAHQKGTGRWVSQDAMDLGVAVPTIDTAVSARILSGEGLSSGGSARELLGGPGARFAGDPAPLVEATRDALHAGAIIAFAQGLTLLRRSSDARGYGLSLEAVARLWRGGCIIRAALLEPIAAAFHQQPDLSSLLLDPPLAGQVAASGGALRVVVRTGAELGIPTPGLMSALAYLDAFRSPHLPANLIQAQRDFFGAHTYERIDRPGTFHTRWEEL